MRQNSPDRPGRRSARVYAILLRFYPRAHQQTFGDQMLQTFRGHYRASVETQGESERHFWLGVVGDECKSLVREHRVALAERTWPMKKLLFGILAAGLVVIALLLAYLPNRAASQNPAIPVNDPTWRPILEMAMLLLTLGLYAALVASVAQLVRHAVDSGNRPSWVRVGLTLGGS